MKLFGPYLLLGCFSFLVANAASAVSPEQEPPPPAQRLPEKTGPLAYVDSIFIKAARHKNESKDGIMISSFRGLDQCSEQEFSATRWLADERTDGCLILQKSTAKKLVVRWNTSEISTYSEPDWAIDLIHAFPKPGCEQEHLQFVQPPDTSLIQTALDQAYLVDPNLKLVNPIVKLTVAKSGAVEDAALSKSSSSDEIDQVVVQWAHTLRLMPDPCEERPVRYANLPVDVSRAPKK
jgi:hypothetical protein